MKYYLNYQIKKNLWLKKTPLIELNTKFMDYQHHHTTDFAVNI